MMMMMMTIRMNGAIPSLPCMHSQPAQTTYATYVSPSSPYMFYDAMYYSLLKCAVNTVQYIGHIAYYKQINVGFKLGTIM
jgi:hypothetical protein